MRSQFAHKVYLKKDIYAIFNSLLFEPVFVSKKEADDIWHHNLEHYTQKELNNLYECGILIKDKKQDVQAKKELFTVYNGLRNEINLLYIIPSGGCNLACKYCFIGKIKNDSAVKMDYKTAEAIVNKFSQYIKTENVKKTNIIFYGGEPTLNFDIIQFIVQKFKKKNIPLTFSIVTNGTYLTDEMIHFFKENNFLLGVSIDGPRKLNDINRIYKSTHSGSYDNVIKNIEKLKQSHLNLGLSVTLSENALIDRSFLKWLVELNVKNINFNLLHYTTKNNEWKKYYKKASKFLFKAHDILSKHDIKEDRLLRKFRAFYSGRFKFNDCSAVGGQQLTVKPNGDLTICHGYWNQQKDNVGNIKTSSFQDVFRTKIYSNWKHNLTINNKKCLKCPALYICGRGCPKQAKDLFDSQSEIDYPFCIHTKYSLKELLKRAFIDSISQK